jgi:hypothetical protein
MKGGAQMHSSYQRKVSLIQDQFVKALQIHLSQCCKFLGFMENFKK